MILLLMIFKSIIFSLFCFVSAFIFWCGKNGSGIKLDYVIFAIVTLAFIQFVI